MKKRLQFTTNVIVTAITLVGFSWTAVADVSADSKPPVGRSLFDFLVTVKTTSGDYVYKVPYPFKELVDHISSQATGLGATQSGSQAVEPTTVLIPNGRSLQRDTTNINNPRGLVAFTEHPNTNSDISVVIKDRVFIGLSKKANQLEVISYNEEAGRFEFQLVTDYKDGATPKVLYANRSFCTECHKAATPIFSKNSWDETNANIGVHTALIKNNNEADSFFGLIKSRGSKGSSYSFDTSTDRANRIPHMQKLWNKGCSDPGLANVTLSPDECRAAVFLLGLSAASGVDTWQLTQGTNLDYDKVLATWKKNLTQQDLSYFLGDLPNRNPSGFEEIQLTTIDEESDRIELWTKNLKENHTIDPAEDPKTLSAVPYRYFDDSAPYEEALEIMLSSISSQLTPAERNALGKSPAKFNAQITSNFDKIVQAGSKSKAFNGSPMVKAKLLAATYDGAGITQVGGHAISTSCCEHADKLPPVELDAGSSNESSKLAVFDKHCYASCHGTFPEPLGFLKRQQGMSDREVWLKIVETQADQLCVRLDWNLPATELAPNQRMPRGPKQDAFKAEEKNTGTSDRKIMIETYKEVLEEFANDQAALQTLGLTAANLKAYADTCNWTVYKGN